MSCQAFFKFACFSTAICLLPLAALAEEPTPQQLDFFEKHIRPVLVARCYKCHAADSKEIKGGLRVDTREGIRKGGESGPAVEPGDTAGSLLLDALRHESFEMPPNEKLNDDIIAKFEKWIEMGAPDPREGPAAPVQREIDFDQARNFWAFQIPVASKPPQVKQQEWPDDEIDQFILSGLEAEGLAPSGPAAPHTLLRRIYFDLIGLPPPPEALAAFEKDPSPVAIEKIVDELLASPQYGERWGRHWLDVVRYAESNGRERNFAFPEAWRFRDYVIDAFNRDVPFDRFIHEQLAGDLLESKSDEQRTRNLTATGMLAIGPKLLNENNREAFLMDMVDEQIDVTTRAFMALTVSCARCHDHKFDPIPTRDYYALAGIYRSTSTHYGVAKAQGNRQASTLLPLGDQQDLRERTEIDQQMAELNRQIKKLQKKEKDEAKLAKLQEQLKQLRKSAPAGSGFVMAVQEGKPEDCHIRIRGEPADRGDLVPRGFVTIALPGEARKVENQSSGRLEIAQWITSPENPLTARVAVNRIWKHLLGRGIVETVDNFGANGSLPSHPALLDYLAVEFQREGWSTKQMIRRIVLSRTYQMASDYRQDAYQHDPDNTLLWRAAPRRLDAESLRDAMLFAGGQLDLTPAAGSPVSSLGNADVGRGVQASDISMTSKHRSVYLPILRNAVPESLAVFDFAEPSLIVGQRDVTTVPAQALYFMNSPLVMEQAELLAKRILKNQQDETERIAAAYVLVLSRKPTSSEANRALEFIGACQKPAKGKPLQETEAWTAVCQSLFASAEFRMLQ